MARCQRMNALTFEKASSIGFRSGEYGGKNSMRISVMTQNSEYTGKVPKITHENVRPVQEFLHHDEYGHYPSPRRWDIQGRECITASAQSAAWIYAHPKTKTVTDNREFQIFKKEIPGHWAFDNSVRDHAVDSKQSCSRKVASTNKDLLLYCTSAFFRSSTSPCWSPFVLGNLIKKAKLFRGILRDVSHVVSTEVLIAFCCDLLEFFGGNPSTDKFSMDGCEMRRYKAVGFQQWEQFI